MEALKANVWSTFGSDVQLALSEVFHLIGLARTGLAVGSPIWLITGTINSSHVVPTTCRLFLIMSCDLTLVLARAFKEVTFRAQGQPNEKDVSAAARNYAVSGYAQHVHRDIKKLIPRKSLAASLKVDNVQREVDDLLIKYKDRLMDDIDLPLEPQRMRIEAKLSDDTSTEDGDLMLRADANDARATLAELEANSQTFASELDGSAPMAELPATTTYELDNHKTITAQADLEGSATLVSP